MDYLILAITIVGVYHTYSFAKWLRQQGNTVGTLGVMFLIAASIALPIYRIVIKKLS